MSKYSRVGVALIAALAVGGCGSGSSVSLSSKTPTKAEAAAAAGGINLVAADLPSSYKGAPHDNSANGKTETAAFAACVGASDPDTGNIDDVYSEDFSTGGQLDMKQVSSEVQVVTSASRASADLKAYRSEKTKACLTTFVAQLLTTQTGGAGGVTFGTPTVTKLTPHANGTGGAFGYQVVLTASAAGVKIPFEVTIEGLLVKHSEVALTLLSIGGPFPTSDRDALFAKLVERSVKSAV